MEHARLKLKLQLVCGNSFAMGPGKAALLEAIDREGSISGAGRAMKMSYRKAWLLVDEMNRCFAGRIVDAAPGGPNRGARLTPLGRRVLAAFREMEAEARRAADGDAYRRLKAIVLDAPRPARD